MKDKEKIASICVGIIKHESVIFSDLVKYADLDPFKDLRYTDLSYINFGTSDLSRYDFRGCNLRNCDLRQANIEGTIFLGAKVDGAQFPFQYTHEGKAVLSIIAREIDVDSRLRTVRVKQTAKISAIEKLCLISAGILNSRIDTRLRNHLNIYEYYKMTLKSVPFANYVKKYYKFESENLLYSDLPKGEAEKILLLYGITKSEMVDIATSLLKGINMTLPGQNIIDACYRHFAARSSLSSGKLPLCAGLMCALAIKEMENKGIDFEENEK